MTSQPMPAAEVNIDEELVGKLLREQHPDLADQPIRWVARGWDNELFLLGSRLCVRLPRRALAVGFAESEWRWLRQLAPRLPLAVPAPLRRGGPGSGYPWKWTVCPWLPGTAAVDTPPVDLREAARQLGEFVRALHVAAPAEAPKNPFRGGALTSRDENTQRWIHALASDVDVRKLRALWERCRDAPSWSGPALWLHGDLHPANLLVHEGRLSAVIDFGDVTAGDPATDLAVAWMLFDRAAREIFRVNAGEVDDACWTRARGWALSVGAAAWAHSADNPRMARMGRAAITALLEEDDS